MDPPLAVGDGRRPGELEARPSISSAEGVPLGCIWCSALVGQRRPWSQALESLYEPLLLQTPLVRSGSDLTVGPAEEAWRSWLSG